MTRDEAVRLFVRQQVTPLLKHGQISHYLRIFAWETLTPTSVWRDFIASEKLPILDQAEKIVRRFLPATATRAKITIATIWLTQMSRAPAGSPSIQRIAVSAASILSPVAVARDIRQAMPVAGSFVGMIDDFQEMSVEVLVTS